MAAIFPYDIFQWIFLDENVRILIKMPLKFVPKGSIDYSSIGSDNGLVPNKRQAIIWTKWNEA